jgi:hypothetical protein
VTTTHDGVVLRATSSTVVFLAVVGICVVLVGDAALRGRWDVVLASLPASGLAVWAAAVAFGRPCLRLTDSGLSIVNVPRTTDAPWALVEDVTTRYQVVVALKDGSSIRSWGAPASPRAGAGFGLGERHKDSSGRVTGSTAHRVIDDALARHSDDDRVGDVRRSWHRWSIVTGAVLFVTVIAQWAAAVAA